MSSRLNSTKKLGSDKMKNKKSLISIGLILVLVAAMLPSGLHSEDIVYSGMPNGAAIIKNASFTDVSGNANTDNILRMAVYSLVNEFGSTRYRPNDYATRQDVLAAIVRTIGKQQEAMTLGESIRKQNTKLSAVQAYMVGYIDTAKNAGIITTKEIDSMAVLTTAEKAAVEKEVAAIVKANWKMTKAEKDLLLQNTLNQRAYDKALKTAATREEIAVWTAKALGLTPVTGEKTMEAYTYRDWKSIATANLPYVESVIRNGILKGETASSYVPKGRLRRGDFASMLSRIADNGLDALELTIGYGRIDSKNVTKEVSSFKQITTTNITVQTPDGTVINMAAINDQYIPVIKNGKVGNESLIQKNDIVEYTLTKDNKVLLLQVGRLKEIKGSFIGYSSELGTVQMSDQSGKRYQLKLTPNTTVTAQKVPVEIGRIALDLPATAIYEGNTLRALDVNVAPDKINNQDIAVKILFADPLGRILKVANEYDDRQYLQLADDVTVYINDEQQGVEAIGFDQDAILKVVDNKVLEVRVYTDIPVEEEGYTQIVTGKVRDISGNNLYISPDGDPEVQSSFIIGNNVPIIKEKQNVSKYKLVPGDRVKLYIDTSMGDYISKIEIQSSGVKIKNLYKGEIKDVIPSTGEIILSNVYTYGYYDWVKQGDYIKYKLSDEAALYNGNSKIEIAKLKDSIGKTIYAVSKDNYGDEEIVHGLLKDGYEDTIYKKITDVKWTSNQITLSDGRIMDYNNGSIIIKDGKLMDSADLKEDTSAFVIQNKGSISERTASIISMDSFNVIAGYSISKGYLHTMGEDYFTIESAYKLTNNSWESYKGFNYQLNDDTYIYDNLVLNEAISADKFAESRFKPYTYTWTNYSTDNYGCEYHVDDKYHSDYIHYYYYPYYHEHSILYTVTDEYGNAIGINIYGADKEEYNPNRENKERITTGQLQSVDSDNFMITINKAMEFSPLYQEWRPATVSIPLDTSKAVLMKDGKPIDLNELTSEDRIYAVSIDGNAVLILAE